MTILLNAIDNLANLIGIQTDDIHAKISAILHASIVDSLSENLVLTASPLIKSERQFIQKGIALIPLNLQKGYMYTLLNSFSPICEMPDESRFNNIELGSMPDIIASSKIIKIILTNSCFLNARLDLNSMNLNAFTLFRGLDGLGKHLSDILNSFELYERLKKS